MIIFGTRGVHSTLQYGDFNCPQCEDQTEYKLKKSTKFFTLYFIPIIPLGKLGEFVECQQCKSTYIPKVLDYGNEDNDQFLSEYEKALRTGMILVMKADGVIEEEELFTVQILINKFSHNDITLDELKELANSMEDNIVDMIAYFKNIASNLNEHGKEMIIKCALSVASADGHIDRTEMLVIDEISESLEMSKAHYKGIISEYQGNFTPSAN